MKHPRLYKKTSTDAIQYWEIETVGPKIITRFGQVGGKEQVAEDVIKEGKNLGRSNATTPTEQAGLEAASQWDKKLKKGYVTTLSGARAGQVDSIIEGGIFPMLAHKFRDHAAKIVYPAFAQPKLDGHRCIAMLDSQGKCTLWSRTRKPILSCPHIVAAMEKAGWRDCAFDGELYNHAYHTKFDELTHFIRQKTPIDGHEVVQYHVYDVVHPGPFRVRDDVLHATIGEHDKGRRRIGPYVHEVETILVNDEEELMVAFERFVGQGYEGAMVRNADGLYVNKRSYDLQKIKEFDDGEFTVTGVKEGRGKLAGRAIFICFCPPGAKVPTFDVKMKGKLDDLKQYFDDPSLVINKELTVQHQGFTKDGVPRFPIGLRIREDV